MFDPAAWLFSGSFFPYVEGPLPERIGVDFPFAIAGAAGVLAGALGDASGEERDRLVRLGVRAGLGVGWLFYLLSLAIQVELWT